MILDNRALKSSLKGLVNRPRHPTRVRASNENLKIGAPQDDGLTVQTPNPGVEPERLVESKKVKVALMALVAPL